MFRSQVLRSAATLSHSAAQVAPKVRVSLNTGYISSVAGLYAKKVPYVLQWGVLLGGMLFHPYALMVLVNKTHLDNYTTPPSY